MEQICESIVSKIHDYRADEITYPTVAHVQRWICQFPEELQSHIVEELNHVLAKSYISKQDVSSFISGLVKNKKLAGENPLVFWQKANFLSIQRGGSSQKELLELFDKLLTESIGISVDECGSNKGEFVYIDDFVFSGNRVRSDLENWIENYAPSECRVNIIVIAFHRGGQWYASEKLKQKAKKCDKLIDFTWWRVLGIEDRKAYMSRSDVLRPTKLPEDHAVREYVEMLSDVGYPPTLRLILNPPYNSQFFSSEQGRQLLEEVFLIAGSEILKMCPNLPERIRPLGYSALKTLGFGSMIVTYRNCPNTCPPASWVGDPWYPLFPRKTN
jgi:hypothetical protein